MLIVDEESAGASVSYNKSDAAHHIDPNHSPAADSIAHHRRRAGLAGGHTSDPKER
jgi:hypothetical protein